MIIGFIEFSIFFGIPFVLSFIAAFFTARVFVRRILKLDIPLKNLFWAFLVFSLVFGTVFYTCVTFTFSLQR